MKFYTSVAKVLKLKVETLNRVKNLYIRKNIFPDYKLWKHVSFKILNYSCVSAYHHTPLKKKNGSASLYISTPWCFMRGKFSNKLLLLEVIAFYSPISIKNWISSIVIQIIYDLCTIMISWATSRFRSVS